MKVAFITLTLILVASAAPKLHFRNFFKHSVKVKPNPRIIGGTEAPPHSIPYQVMLEVYALSEAWYCGGSLISPNYVLTAAHCNDEGVIAIVILGAHKFNETESTQVIQVSRYLIIHDQYDSENITNDIGLIKLPTPVTLTDAIQIVKLPIRADIQNSYVGETGRVSGWGVTDGFSKDVSEVLNFVDVEVITNEECEEYFGDLPPTNVCTSGANDSGACSGDSGGALVVDGVQIGVVSFGIFFCLFGYPSAFTRVTEFLDFIQNNTDVLIN